MLACGQQEALDVVLDGKIAVDKPMQRVPGE
jgi:hypothetical protein